MKAIAKLFYLDAQHADRAKQNGNIIWFTDSKNKHAIIYNKKLKHGGKEFDCYIMYKEHCDGETAKDYYEDGMADKALDAGFEEVAQTPGSTEGIIHIRDKMYSYQIRPDADRPDPDNKFFIKLKKSK